MLCKTRLRKLISRLPGEFDHVLTDSPPLVSHSDAAVIAPHTDGILLAIRAGKTPRKAVAHAQFPLERVGLRIFGTVLTHAETA